MSVVCISYPAFQQASSLDSFTLSSADEGLADLQPEDSEGEEEGGGAKAELSPDQKVHGD